MGRAGKAWELEFRNEATYVRTYVRTYVYLASFPGSPSFRAIIPRMTFDPPEGIAEGEPGRFCHMTSVMPRHPYTSGMLSIMGRA